MVIQTLALSVLHRLYSIELTSVAIPVPCMCKADTNIIECLQWNLSTADTLEAKIIVLISEMSLFQGENNIYNNSVKCPD